MSNIANPQVTIAIIYLDGRIPCETKANDLSREQIRFYIVCIESDVMKIWFYQTNNILQVTMAADLKITGTCHYTAQEETFWGIQFFGYSAVRKKQSIHGKHQYRV